MPEPIIPEGYTAYQRDPGETAIGYEEYIVWMDGLPVGSASFIAGQGSKALAVAQYLERRKAS